MDTRMHTKRGSDKPKTTWAWYTWQWYIMMVICSDAANDVLWQYTCFLKEYESYLSYFYVCLLSPVQHDMGSLEPESGWTKDCK